MPLTRNLSGSTVSIERTVYGHLSASLVWDKTVEDILCSFVDENGFAGWEGWLSCGQQRNTFDLQGSQSGFAATFSESDRSHHGRNNHHNQRGCFVRNSTLSPQEKTLQHMVGLFTIAIALDGRRLALTIIN